MGTVGRPSLIAQVNAFFRARESLLPAERRILQDAWAAHLHPGTLFFQAIRFARFIFPPLWRLTEALQTAHCVRHAAVDALILRAVAEGYAQVVVLGAGYDMRRARFAAALGQTAWFEVDRAATLALKARLPAQVPSEGLRRVEGDLADGDLVARLLDQGLRAERPTLLVLEGVAHYLSIPALQALIAQFQPVAQARLVISFIRPEMARRGDTGIFRRIWSWTGEPPQTWLDDAALRAVAPGWRVAGTLDQAAQIRELVPRAAGRSTGMSQDLAVLEKEP